MIDSRALGIAIVLASIAAPALAQAQPCPPPAWPMPRLDALRREKFKIADPPERHALARALTACLGHPNPAIRDGIAFEALAAFMRAGDLDRSTLTALKAELLDLIARPDEANLAQPFAALVLAEVARTDRLDAWMAVEEREVMVRAAAAFLSSVNDYRAYSNTEGFRHAVAHGADFALQLALNPAITKPQLDQLLSAIAVQIAPRDPNVAYWAGEPDRLARSVLFIAQRKLHSDAEWKAWFDRIMDPKPLASWNAAFESEAGIRKRHNTRAFLLSVFATASTSEEPGIRQLATPVRDALKTVQ